MNKQSLYLFGGALLATTALSSAGQAATVKLNTGDATLPATAALTAIGLATQVFSATASTANAAVLGGNGSGTAAGEILIDYTSGLSTAFNIQLDVTNASFVATPTLKHYRQTTSGTLELLASVTGCTIQTVPDKILISSCDPTTSSVVNTVQGGTVTRVDAISIVGVSFNSAAALAVAGTSVTLSGTIKNTNNTVTYENITSVNYITSKSAVDSNLAAGVAVTIDNTASPAFTLLSTGTNITTTTAQLGSVKFSSRAAVGTDLSLVFTQSIISSTVEIKLTHGVLSDAAVVSVGAIAGSAVALTSKTPLLFVSGTVSFQFTGLSLNGSTVSITFDGTTAITGAAAGTGTLTPTTLAPLVIAVPAVTGSLASISRGGLSVELNSLYPTSGTGSTLYRSYLRIANTSAVDGVATITVKNDGTGATIGSFTTSIAAGATRQIGSADIETSVTTAAATGAAYKVVVSGSFNGYVQNLMWNSVSGLFTDLSGFRNGALTGDP